ncbi:MAG TPA: sensor histidine kinase, partial [Phenylobacterium sp.]
MRLPGGLTRPSLARRLALLAVGWSFAALVIAAVVLALLFQQAALRRFDANLSDLIDNLISGSTVEDGEVVAPALTDQRALRAYSGRYWDIAEPLAGGGVRSLVPSRSLWDSSLKIPVDLPQRLRADPRKPIAFDAPGVQAGERLRVVARWTSLPGRDAPLVFIAAEDRRPIDRDVRNFFTTTAIAFAMLGVGLILAVVVQVRVGLRPLFRLRQEVADVRRGKADRLQADYPSELKPLTDELNALVAHNQETVERQRTHVGNLAHALKTPISVMMTEASQRPGPLGEV